MTQEGSLLRRAGVVLVTISEDAASRVMAHFDPGVKDGISPFLESLRSKPPSNQERIAALRVLMEQPEIIEASFNKLMRSSPMKSDMDAIFKEVRQSQERSAKPVPPRPVRKGPLQHFDDLGAMEPRGIQILLANVDTSTLSLALKTASEELKDVFFRCISARACDLIKEEMEFMGPVRLADVEQAQETIVTAAEQLVSTGQMVFYIDPRRREFEWTLRAVEIEIHADAQTVGRVIRRWILVD